ncbi:hypothetical protein JOM56_003713 [Amanita muscaria]
MSTMLDTYDTQMLDYHAHDMDVQMNTSVGSDSWVQEEATMEDDGFIHKSTLENVSIEIDMDDYDEIPAENDMSKDLQGTYGDGIADIVDIEVYDTSQLHSPAVFPHPIPEETYGLANDPQVARHNTDPDNLPTVEKEQLDDRVGLPSDILDYLPTEQTVDVLATDKAELVGSADTANSQVESNVLVEVDSHAASIIVPTSDDQGIDEANVPWTNSADGPVDPSSNDVHGIAEEKGADPAAPVVEVPEDKETGHTQEHYPQDTDHQDPHEISEGVYIDPPPPVLLTIDIIGHYDINLFNEVLDVGTVEDGGGEQDSNPSIVLLQDRPTLYYENLSNLFEALRQDTSLTNLTEISEGELVLEAYDLRLVMPEDNCYVRGISLHDINILHDSYGLSGPLRLRLRLESPRFIILYQRLQDRTAQLSVETHTDANTLNEQTFQGESGHEYQDSAGLGKTVEEESHDSNSDDGVTNQDTLPEDDEQRHEVEDGGDQEPDAQQAPWSDDDSGLQYADRAEPDVGTAAAESEATSTTSEPKSTASKVTDAASDASAKDVGEVSNGEANQDHATGETTPRLPSPSVSEEKDEQQTAVIAAAEDRDSSRPDENENPQNVDSAAPLMEQSILDANPSAIIHELSQSELTGEYEHAPSEEHDDPDFLGSEPWDAQFGEDGDLDAAWDYETDKDEDEEEERDGQDSTSVESSVTLSSKLSSKRSFHELDEDEYDSPNHSPGLKKPRME